jgi:hypothetical protein
MKTLFTLLVLAITTWCVAHETDCPYCKLPVLQNTEQLDNEVVVKFGNKRIEYRCIACVILDQKRYTGDLIVYAPSEKIGEPVVIKRIAGKWSTSEGVVLINQFKKHADCAQLSRAFHSRNAFDAFVTKNQIVEPKALTLEQFLIEVLKP